MYKNQIVIYNLYYTMVVSFYGRRQSITKKINHAYRNNPTEKPKKTLRRQQSEYRNEFLYTGARGSKNKMKIHRRTKTADGKIAGKIRKAATRRNDLGFLMTKLLDRIVSEIVRSSSPSSSTFTVLSPFPSRHL